LWNLNKRHFFNLAKRRPQRHYDAKHALKFNDLEEHLGSEKLQQLKYQLSGQK
jgi:hypothetical protein